MLEEFDYAGRVIVYASITNGRCKILYYFNSKHIKQLQGRTNHLMVAIMKYKHMLTPTPYHSTKTAKPVKIIIPRIKEEKKIVASISVCAPYGTLLQ